MSWREVWSRRSLDRSRPILEALMAADGLDTAYGSVSAESWSAFASREAERLAVKSIFEVGCGAGAFLYEFDRLGLAVGGLDLSPALIAIAREIFPRGDFLCAEASALPAEPAYDAVVSCGVFLYFPSLDYARSVLSSMARKARSSIALYDLPDLALQDAAMSARRASLAPGEYEKRYAGLDHRFYSRDWIASELRALGFPRVEIESQQIAGYANGAFRFNARASR
jgi:SAM-dependent methyltransferase